MLKEPHTYMQGYITRSLIWEYGSLFKEDDTSDDTDSYVWLIKAKECYSVIYKDQST